MATILAALLAVGIAVLSVAFAKGNTQALMDGSVIAIGVNGAAQFRWAMILDMFGYYLLLIPLALLLWSWLKPYEPEFIRFFTVCGLAYILIGRLAQSSWRLSSRR